MRRRPDVLAAAVMVAAAGVFVALCASLGEVWDGTAAVSDLPLYERYGKLLEAGDLPYRDFSFEYPPGSLPAVAVPALLSDSHVGFARVFAALMVSCGVAAIVLTGVGARRLGAGPARLAAALAVFALSPVLLGELLLTRFDLLPAAVTAGAIAALLAGRNRLAALALGVGIAVKLWPAVLLPLLAAWVWKQRGRREAVVCAASCLGVLVAALAPYLVLAPDGVVESLWRQVDRPLQIESLGAAVLLALHHVAAMPLGWASGHGSQNLTGAVAVIAAVVTSALQLAVLAYLWTRFARGSPDARRLARYAAASAVAFVALGKVLSPQFLIWLLPLVPLVAGPRGLAASLLLGSACLLTRGWFPDRYWELVKEFDPVSSWLVLLRDLTLVALLSALAVAGRRRRSVTATGRVRARSSTPAPSPGRS